jgi:hypothetical protein
MTLIAHALMAFSFSILAGMGLLLAVLFIELAFGCKQYSDKVVDFIAEGLIKMRQLFQFQSLSTDRERTKQLVAMQAIGEYFGIFQNSPKRSKKPRSIRKDRFQEVIDALRGEK